MRLSAGRVLVVDTDDGELCGLTASALRESDHHAVCVRSARDAYAAIPTLPTFMALVLDVPLGENGTGGFDLARFARLVIPEIAVLFVCGEASREAVAQSGVDGSGFLPRPFTLLQLRQALQLRLAA